MQGVAGGCKTRIFKRFPLPRVAECCTVLRSRWYQNGIRMGDSFSLTMGPMARPRAPVRLHSKRPARAPAGSTQPWQQHDAFGLDDSWWDGRDDGRRGLHEPRSLRGLCRARPLTPTGSRTGGDHGLPLRPQTRQSEGADRVEGLRASLPTRLLAGPQPHRRSFRQGQGYAAPSKSPHEGRFGECPGKSALDGQRPRRPRLLRACWLSATSPTTMKHAVVSSGVTQVGIKTKCKKRSGVLQENPARRCLKRLLANFHG